MHLCVIMSCVTSHAYIAYQSKWSNVADAAAEGELYLAANKAKSHMAHLAQILVHTCCRQHIWSCSCGRLEECIHHSDDHSPVCCVRPVCDACLLHVGEAGAHPSQAIVDQTAL